jgi:perosamine synthetase
LNFIHQIEPYLTEAEENAVQEYLRSKGWLTEHKATRDLESLVQNTVGVNHVIAVSNGTVGLYLSLLAALPPDSVVVVPAYTMVATINAVLWARMRPLIVDIDPATGCLDLNLVPTDQKVAGILYVAINGRTGNMHHIVHWCMSHDIVLIEDACQAFMSAYKYHMCGTFGKLGVYSLSPHKIVTTGQGGLIVTNEYDKYHAIKRMKDFGRDIPGTDRHPHYGLNFKFTDLQAVIGIQQLNIIAYRIRRKLAIFNKYKEGLPKSMRMLPLQPGNVPWFMDVLCENKDQRDALEIYLKEKNIGTRKFYLTLAAQPYVAKMIESKNIHITSVTEAEKLSDCGIWLPSSIGLTDDQLDYILTAIYHFK